ncbi:HEAT repeat domain-containing protein [Paenibacillus oleatilyticus]|uniref:HEAT repeat domain-containing protein n=1 Tax=Paenibacillus oleatilyticus TaxID=2594886 RepID=A0ABV4V7L0_9BACL|nr:HEAT repeat domain-containing protein [Paenibacillus oleatilyticus]MBU7317867.1 HEAT repeat domain-containing protein [Paenibacillus oleatilyticus]
MSRNDELTGYGRHHLQMESYGAAAFCFYRAIKENEFNGNAWNGLILSLSLMRREEEIRTTLARFALQPGLDFDRDLLTFVFMMWQQNPRALAEWLRRVVQFNGIPEKDQLAFTEIAEDAERAYEDLVAKYGAESLHSRGMLTLEEYAARPIQLDWLLEAPVDTIYEQLQWWLEDKDSALSAVRLLCMLPDTRSEKLLRRVCRNVAIEPKVRTHALLALRWLGVRGNAKLYKFNESFVIDLDNPKPELTISVPAVYKPALDRVKLWAAKEKGLVTPEVYEQYASTDEVQLPPEIVEKLDEAEVPPLLQEVSHALIRAAHDEYYPLVPTISGTRQWSAALLMLMKDYAVGIGEEWPYGEPEQDETAKQHRNWLLSASPDFYPSIEEVRKLKES